MAGSEPREWDAAATTGVSDPQEEWARQVLRAAAAGGRRRPSSTPAAAPAASPGCWSSGCPGQGDRRRRLARRWSRRRARALGDRRRRSPASPTCSSWSSHEPVDAVFSNAIFHWIPDHERLFARLRAALRPGGRLVAQCGGEGNVAEFAAAIEAVAERPEFAAALRGDGRRPGTSPAPRRPRSACAPPASRVALLAAAQARAPRASRASSCRTLTLGAPPRRRCPRSCASPSSTR